MRASLGDVRLWCRVPEYQLDVGACGTRYCCYERVIEIRCRQVPPGDAIASEGASAMDVVIGRCAGIAIGKKTMAVTIRAAGQVQGRRRQQTRTFGMVTSQVLALRDRQLTQLDLTILDRRDTRSTPSLPLTCATAERSRPRMIRSIRPCCPTRARPSTRSPTWSRRPSPSGGIALRYGGFYGAANDALIEPVRKRQFPIVGDGGGIFPGCTSTTVRQRPCSPSSTPGRRSTTSSTTIPPRCATFSRCSRRPGSRRGRHQGTRRPQRQGQGRTWLDPPPPDMAPRFPATYSAIAIADGQAANGGTAATERAR
jgi:hypothetical protein